MSNHNRESRNSAFEMALTVLEAGWATIDELRRADEWRHRQRPRLGKLAMKHGKLTMSQVFAILGEQAGTSKLFGETAVVMGFLDKGQLYELLLMQADLTPTLAEALVTLGMITPEQASFVSKRAEIGRCRRPTGYMRNRLATSSSALPRLIDQFEQGSS